MQFNAIQCNSGNHVNPGSPWCIRPYICLLALCQLDAWMEGWTDIANGWIRASTIIGTLIQCTVECPLLLFAGGSVAGKGTGPNLQHLVAISPWLLIALARTSKQTTTCHVMSHLSESVRIYHQPHHQQQYDQTKITQYKTDNANNY